MSIAEKLVYLAETKEAIREAINTKGGALTDEPFRAYAEAIMALSGNGGMRFREEVEFKHYVISGSVVSAEESLGRIREGREPQPRAALDIFRPAGGESFALGESVEFLLISSQIEEPGEPFVFGEEVEFKHYTTGAILSLSESFALGESVEFLAAAQE